jgi:hypothetical protein
MVFRWVLALISPVAQFGQSYCGNAHMAGSVLPKPLKCKLGFLANDKDADVGINKYFTRTVPRGVAEVVGTAPT